jgi:hypothetical protein
MPALTFTGGDSDRINLGTAAALSDLQSGTIMVLVNSTSLPNAQLRGLFGKGDPATTNNWWLNASGGSNGILMQVPRATTGMIAVALWADMPGAVINRWLWIVSTWDLAGASSDQHLYCGPMTGTIHEATYTARNVGSGATTSNAAATAYLGSLTGGASESWPGRIACVLVWNRPLSLPDIRRLAKRIPLSAAPGGLRGGWALGRTAGTGIQHDFSPYGNHGTVTGATFSRSPELDHLFRQYRRPILTRRVALAAGFNPAWARGSNQLLSGGYAG